MSPEWYEALHRILLDTSLRAPLFAAIVALILMVVRVRSNSVRHAAWTVVLFSMLLMPVLPYLIPSIPLPVPAGAIQAKNRLQEATLLTNRLGRDVPTAPIRGIREESSSAAAPERKSGYFFAVIIVYCLGVFILLSRALWGWRAMTQLACGCRPVVLGPWVMPKVRKIQAPVCESEMVATPLTVGIMSTRIILPIGWRTWAPEKLSAVLAHEFSHVQRRDTLIALLSHLNKCLFWFHPFAWWLERKLAATAELACDDAAIRTIGGTKFYAGVLLDMAQEVHQRGGRLAWQSLGVHGNGLLGRRIDRLLGGEPFREITRIRKTIVAFGCAAAIVLVVACREKPRNTAPQELSKPAALQQSIWAKRVLIMTDPINAPFEFGDGTGVQGLDVDIGNEVAKNLGLKVKWVKAPGVGYKQNRLQLVVDALLGRCPGDDSLSDYAHMFEFLKRGQTDILISAIAVDPQRSADFEFSKPYYDTGDIIAHRRDRFDITDLASLSGKKVGVAAGRPGDSFMACQKIATAVMITRYSSLDDALGALNRAEIDAVVGDEPMMVYSSVKSFYNTTTEPILVNKYKYAAAVQKGKTKLLATLNQTIDQLQSTGALQKLDVTWLGNVRKDRNPEVANLKNKNP